MAGITIYPWGSRLDLSGPTQNLRLCCPQSPGVTRRHPATEVLDRRVFTAIKSSGLLYRRAIDLDIVGKWPALSKVEIGLETEHERGPFHRTMIVERGFFSPSPMGEVERRVSAVVRQKAEFDRRAKPFWWAGNAFPDDLPFRHRLDRHIRSAVTTKSKGEDAALGGISSSLCCPPAV